MWLKCTIYSCLSDVLFKYLTVLKIKLYLFELLLKIFISNRKELGIGHEYHRQGRESVEKWTNWFVDNNKNVK